MRKQLLGVFLPLLVLVLMAAGETQSTGAESASHAMLQKVNVLHGENGISVEITGRGQLKPELSMVDSPARLVVDLPATVMATSQSRIGVDSDGVKGVRIGMDGQTPPTTRVVIDLAQACRYDLLPISDNKFTLKLYTGASTAKTTTKPNPAAAVAQSSLAKKELAMSTPAPVLGTQKKQVQPASSATEFVFVEPSYKTKDTITEEGSKTSPVAPADRAINAAAKFAERPETLLPAPSASMQPQASQAVAPTSGPQPAVNMAAEQKAQSQQSPAITGPKYTGEPISVNLKDVDLKDFFRLIHEISGLNVVLDPNVKGSLTIVLDDVPWDQALDIVLKNNDLARQLDGNVLRIATVETLRKEAESRRAQIEAEALAVEKVTVTRF
jgi:type IV pilus assembly protein PilQ